jgi:iron-sulfur cluster repair protein YtfE (RIC family)
MSVRDPIAQLLEEHRAIMSELEGLRRAVRDLEARGEAAVAGSLAALQSAGEMMGTRLLAHAHKEDEVLFPALESVFGEGGGPTVVMRQEHRDIHAEADRFRRTLRELEEVEHPAIAAGGEALRRMATAGATAADLRTTAVAVIRLLDAHFAKEEDILFPMARQVLGAAALAEVGRRMEAIEPSSASQR